MTETTSTTERRANQGRHVLQALGGSIMAAAPRVKRLLLLITYLPRRIYWAVNFRRVCEKPLCAKPRWGGDHKICGDHYREKERKEFNERNKRRAMR